MAGALMALVVASPAAAAAIPATVTISIKPSGMAFRGAVDSPSPSCVANRKVVLQRKKDDEGSFFTVGGTVSATDGTWTLEATPVRGAEYRVHIKSEAVGADTCDEAISSTTTMRPTRITIDNNGTSFYGSISPPWSGFPGTTCLGHRRVYLQARPGTGPGPFTAIASTTASFGWSIPGTPAPNTAYRARAAARQAGLTISCMATISASVIWR